MRASRSHLWMAAGLAAGLALGLAAAKTRWPTLLVIAHGLQPFGTLFQSLLSMTVIPLVAVALFAGVAGLGDLRHLSRLGARALGFFGATTIAAIVIGFVVAGLILPYAAVTPELQAALRDAARSDPALVRRAAEQGPAGAAFIVELIPANPVRAAVDGNLLPLIVFIAILAVATAALPDEKRRVLTDLADTATQAMIHIVRWVLLIAPLGIFALVASAVARFAPGRYLRAIRPSMLMAFSTTSSLATLPVMLEAADTDLRVPRTVSTFVLPLGASIGRAGSALFQAIAVVFVARLYDVALGAGDLFQAGAAVFLTSLTVASVPSASIVSLAPAFAATGLPLTGLQLLLGPDRIPDMFRTMTNVVGTLTGATVIGAAEEGRRD